MKFGNKPLVESLEKLDAEDIALTVHAHPTLHESVGLAAEIQEGSITDMPNPKAKKKK